MKNQTKKQRKPIDWLLIFNTPATSNGQLMSFLRFTLFLGFSLSRESKYNISVNLIRVIKHLYDKATSAVFFNGSIGDLFRSTVGIRQGCLLSPTLFNIFLKRIMTDALEDHGGTVSIGGRTITSLSFADNIDGLAREEEDLAKVVERLDKASTAYGMEISAEKTKLMTNNTSGINIETKVNGWKLEIVISFKHLGSFTVDEGFKPEILSRIAKMTAALTRF